MFTIWSVHSMLILLVLSYHLNIALCLSLWGKLLSVVFLLNCRSNSNLSVIQLASSCHCFSQQGGLCWFTSHMMRTFSSFSKCSHSCLNLHNISGSLSAFMHFFLSMVAFLQLVTYALPLSCVQMCKLRAF